MDADVADERSAGQRVADAIVTTLGSWRFIIIQSILLVLWIIFNGIAWLSHWDPYPFIALNLLLSCQAAYATPMVMMSQNRQAEKDRKMAEQDLASDLKAEQILEKLIVQEEWILIRLQGLQDQYTDIVHMHVETNQRLDKVEQLAEIRRRRHRSEQSVAKEVLPTNVYPLRHQDESQEV